MDVAGDLKVMRRVRSIGFMALLFGFPLTTGGNDNKGMPGSGRRWGDAPGRVNGGDMPGSGRLGIADGAGDVKVMRRVKSIGFMALLFGFPLTTGGNDRRADGKNRGAAGRTGGFPGCGDWGECFSVIPAVVSGNPWYSRVVAMGGNASDRFGWCHVFGCW